MTKLFFMISALQKSSDTGGHYISLRETAYFLKQWWDVSIIILGTKKCTIFDHFEKVYRIETDDIHKAFKAFDKLNIINKNITLHTFDTHALLVGQKLSVKYKSKLVATKCGGPTRNLWYPKTSELILYTKEDVKWFNSHPSFRNVNKHYIPNRINQPVRNKEREDAFKKHFKDFTSYYNIVCISRIINTKKKIFAQAIHHLEVTQKKKRAQLFIIGVKTSDDLYQELKKRSDETKNIHILTNSVFTNLASELLPCFDESIAMGRGAMESLVLNIDTYCPSSGNNTPIKITADNIEKLHQANFTGREFEDYKDANKNNISHPSTSYYAKAYFLLHNDLKEKFEEIYTNAKPAGFVFFQKNMQRIFYIISLIKKNPEMITRILNRSK